MTTTFRFAETPDDLLAVFRFRYQIFVQELNRQEKYADHREALITDPLDNGAYNLAAWHDGQVVGHIRTNLLNETDVGEYLDHYQLRNLPGEVAAVTSISTRFSIHARYRHSGLIVPLVCASFKVALTRRVVADYCDCDDALLPVFTRLGYVPSRVDFVHPEYGRGTVMRLNMLDSAHLQSVRSPFARILAEFQRREA
jgi:N-acyl-L-homoserine lactone synthetase